jgi:hypothetical protein
MSNAFELSVAETLAENNLQLKEVAGDGNCFFASLVICLGALPGEAAQKTSMTALRHRFANHLAGRVDELAPFFSADGDTEEDQRTEYLAAVKKIRQSRFWDNQIIDLVVGCATEVLKMNVTVFDIDEEGNVTEYEHVYEPEVHMPASQASSAGGEHLYEPDDEGEEKAWPVVKMLRQDDNHFNAFIAAEDK